MDDHMQLQALCSQFDRRDISCTRFMEACTQLIASVIGCARVGI
jgi:hypothetical protein